MVGEIGESVPFVGTVTKLVKSVTRHVKNVEKADAYVKEAGVRAKAAEDTVRKLEKGRFPKQHPSYTETLEALIHLDELVSKWNDKSSWQKTFGVSMSKGKTQAKKYADKFDDAFKVRCDIFLFSVLFFFHFPL